MRVALIQFTGGDIPSENITSLSSMIREAHSLGVDMILTPEVSNIISSSKSHQHAHIVRQEDDVMLATFRALAAELEIWLLIGSLALRSERSQDRFVNRSILIDRAGRIAAQYDKLHMFDVILSQSERYTESDAYDAGDRVVTADTEFGTLGLSICYDARFAELYRTMARVGASVITVPAAFTVPTGKAHWDILLRARAIETGAYILAPGQTGAHAISCGQPRTSYGHSKIIDPWGRVIAQVGGEEGIITATLDLEEVQKARARIPAWNIKKDYILNHG